jgi:quercetin dioxygenase-like cupin family protein
MKRFLPLFLIVLAVAVVAVAAPKKPADHGLFTPNQITWMDAPNALPAGAKLAVLEGDPFKSGLYTMRLSVPAGYKIPPHFHKKFEHVTVISGAFNLGMGDKFDTSKATAMPVGTFGFLAPGMKHFAFANEPTVIQLHGEGPWEIVYVNPSDDPRKKK